jgi:hypothetical protein
MSRMEMEENTAQSEGGTPSLPETRRLEGFSMLAAGPVRADTKQENNKAVVGRWFADFWGKDVNLAVVDEIAAPDMLLKYSLHQPRRGRSDINAFMTDFRRAFPDLNFWGTVDLIAEGA